MQTSSTDSPRPAAVRAGRGGFTLLEAVASVAILAIALAFLVVGHRTVVRSAARFADR